MQIAAAKAHSPVEAAKKLRALRADLASVDDNFSMAVAFHEVWKPASQDAALHDRMGTSYASQAFLVVRAALRREMLLALMRIWDKTTGARSLVKIVATLRNEAVWEALLLDRLNKLGDQAVAAHLTPHFIGQRELLLHGFDKYCRGGTHYAVYERLRNLRHGSLAHSQAPTAGVVLVDPADDEVSEFYEDTAKLTSVSMSLINGVAIAYSDTSGVYSHYAMFFWASARGERTDGHPNYRRPDNAA